MKKLEPLKTSFSKKLEQNNREFNEIYRLGEKHGVEDTKKIVASAVEWLKAMIESEEKDFANLDIIDKEIALKIIDEAFEDVIEK